MVPVNSRKALTVQEVVPVTVLPAEALGPHSVAVVVEERRWNKDFEAAGEHAKRQPVQAQVQSQSQPHLD